MDDQQPTLPAAAPVHLRVARAAKVIGMPLTPERSAPMLCAAWVCRCTRG